MSCSPAPYQSAARPGAALAAAPVQALLDLFAEELLWLSDRYGLVQTSVREKGKLRHPHIYRQDGSKYSFDVLPATTMAAMCFFERTGASRIIWDDGALQVAGTWEHPVQAVFWCNLPKIDARPDDFSDLLAQDVLRVLIAAGVPVGPLEQRSERVFERYTLADKQLLMYPYAGFRVGMTLSERYTPCLQPFVPLVGPAQCPPPVPEPQP